MCTGLGFSVILNKLLNCTVNYPKNTPGKRLDRAAARPDDQKGSFPPGRLPEGEVHRGLEAEKEPCVLTGKNSLYIKMERAR